MAQNGESNSFIALASSMSRVLDEMKTGGTVAPEIVSEAESHMAKLMQGIRERIV